MKAALSTETRLIIEAAMLRALLERIHGPLNELVPLLKKAHELVDLDDSEKDDARRVAIARELSGAPCDVL